MANEAATGVISAGEQVACRDCGEMVRVGLVRCWNCGGFMDPEVEKRFQEMQKNPPPPILSDPAGAEDAEVADDGTFESEGDESDEGGFKIGGAGKGVDFGGSFLDEDDSSPKAGAAPKAKSGGSAAPVSGINVPTEEEDADDLMSVVMTDLKGQAKREAQRSFEGGVRTAGGFIIFCPYGCKIEVKDKHRGSVGKCPKCRTPFLVPVDPPQYVKKKVEKKASGENQAVEGAVGPYRIWQEDAKLHVVDPEKLKIKADSLTKDFTQRDLLLSEPHLALVAFELKPGRPAKGAKKDEFRAAVKELASKGALPDKLEQGDIIKVPADKLALMRIIQPAQRGQSIFAGVPVFGTGRIAVQLPDLSDGTNPAAEKPHYLSFELTDFREFSKALEDLFGIGSYGEDAGVPLTDDTFEHTCHYTDAKIHALKHLEYYKADPKIELVLAGWQCGECGLTISEDGRAKEGLGGKNGKGIAKTKCPKCEKKMGDHPLYTLPSLVQTAEIQSET